MEEGMSAYLVVLTGVTESWQEDRTLVKIEAVEANNFEEVEQKVVEQIIDEYGDFTDWDGYGWRSIVISEIKEQHVVNVQTYLDKERKEIEAKKRGEQEDRERSEYERLKKKYE
jgi:hypothetical protein